MFVFDELKKELINANIFNNISIVDYEYKGICAVKCFYSLGYGENEDFLTNILFRGSKEECSSYLLDLEKKINAV